MVNSLNGITAADYQAYMKVQDAMMQAGATNPVNLTYENDSVSFSGNKCTDGKDDGKIGFFSAVGNAIEGIGKTVVNGVKGMFTGKDGKFSLGKTLLSVGTAALCIAFPAVGVAACVVGGTMGAVQIGKGIYNAATATSDAEAKQAWEDIGGGAFTVGASVVGAKAGVKAVKATSTAGPNSMSALQSLDDVAAATGQKATIGQKAVALGKDMISSTKNQAGKISNAATPYANAAKLKYAEAKAAKITKNSSSLTPKELHAVNNAKYQRMFASDDTLAALDKIDDIANAANGYKTKISNSEIGTGIEMLREAMKSGNADEIAAAKALLKEASVGKVQTKFNNTEVGTALQMLKEAMKSGNADEIATAKALLKEVSVGKVQTKFNNSEIGTGLQMLKEAMKSGNADEIAAAKALLKEAGIGKIQTKFNNSDLTQAVKMLLEAKKSGNADDLAFAKEYLTFIKDNVVASAGEKGVMLQQRLGLDSVALDALVKEYGYENVQHALQYSAGTMFAV